METIYIDVYFLINFTVDVLALHFASILSKIPTTPTRLLIASAIGALYAVFAVLLIDEPALTCVFAVVFLLLMVLITSHGVGFYRRVKYTVAVVIFNVIIGGLVYYGYCILDKVFNSGDFINTGGENKNLLLFSLLVLFSIGVLKLFLSFFTTASSETKVELAVVFGGVETRFEALVDSGNLARDPFDKTPVMLINPTLSKKIFGVEKISYDAFAGRGYELKKRVRIIPISFGSEKKILYGIKPDNIFTVVGKRTERLSLIIATEEKGDSYGGYSALIPLSAIDKVRYEIN